MFTINPRTARSIEIKKALNGLLGDIWEEIAITPEISLTRHHGHKVIALYQGQEIEVSTAHIDRGLWVVSNGTDTAKIRVLDALNTIA